MPTNNILPRAPPTWLFGEHQDIIRASSHQNCQKLKGKNTPFQCIKGARKIEACCHVLVFILVTNALQSQWLWSGLVGQVLTACPTIKKSGSFLKLVVEFILIFFSFSLIGSIPFFLTFIFLYFGNVFWIPS